MRALSRTAPPLATWLADRLFLMPPRRRLAPAEIEWLATARRLSIETPAGPVAAWHWPGGGATVLLVHGWGGRGGQLAAIGRALAGSGYSAVAFDMPGHGEAPGRTDLLAQAEVVAVVARRFAPIAGVVAHSFGTAATLVAASRHRMDVPRLVALAPAARLETLATQFAGMTGFSREVVERMRGRLARRLSFRWDELEAVSIAPRLHAPALVLHDRDDERIPYRDGADLAALLPGAELVLTSGLGHSGLLRDASVVERICQFFPVPAPAARPGPPSPYHA